MKTIIFVNTVYQLFLTINMKMHRILDDETDIVISDHTPSLRSYQYGLEESNLFHKVYYVESCQDIKRFWRIPQEKQAESFVDLSKSSSRYADIDFRQYEMLFTANFNPYINGIYSQNRHLKVCFYEDGASVCAVDWRKSFQKHKRIPGFFDIFDNVVGLYINSPDLMCVDLGWPIVQLPKILKKDAQVKKSFNSIFSYNGDFQFSPFIFIEQSFPADNVINNDLEFIAIASELVGFDNFLVKPHPRNIINRSVELGYSRKCNCTLPFELLLLNSNLDDTVFITVSSTSLISPWVLFDESPRTIFLYKALTGGINIPAIDKYCEYLDKFAAKYASRNLMVPKSILEYKKLINVLVRKALGRTL